MRFGQDHRLLPAQRLIITPEFRQAVQLLQLPAAELAVYLQQQVLENPVLELADEEGNAEGDADGGADIGAADAAPDGAADAADAVGDETVDPGAATLSEWAEYFSDSSDLGYIPLAEVRLRAWTGVEAIPAESVSLREHLLLQLHLAAAGVEETEAAEVLIEALDDDGYLRIELGELGAATGISPLALRQALNLVQTLDPCGVGARDLSECLLIQLRARGLGGSLAARVVRDHLVRLGEMRLGSIADQLGCAVEEVRAALEVVRALDPRPGRAVGANSRPRYVVPDVTVQHVARSYVVLPNDGAVPRVRISPFYKKLAAQATGAAGAAGAASVAGAVRGASEAEEAAVFLAKRLRDAVHLLRSVEQRRLTVCRVVERIVERQRAFFDHGVRHLAPLTLREVASDLGVHDSTVSRAVSGKYVETPRGTFELKFFFSSGLLAVDGGRVSSRSVKRVIGELIEGEDPSRPHSDRRLVELLGRRGASVSRRTVAKYRHELGVPSSARRRRY